MCHQRSQHPEHRKLGVLSGACCENKWMLTRAGEGHCRQSYPPLQSVSTEHLLFAWCCAGAGEAAVPEAGEARASEELTYSSSRLSNMSSIQPTAVSML